MYIKTLILATLGARVVLADYDSFYFTSNSSRTCMDQRDACAPPAVCAHDSTLDKYYCCIPGAGNVCFSQQTTCSGSNGTAGSGQLGCDGFCCLGNREQCTQRSGQRNICWSLQTNPIVNITEQRMNNTFSSISSRQPTATTFSLALAQVTSTISTTATSTGAGSTTSAGGAASTSSAAGTSSSSTSGLSGGAIAGIVVGVILGLAVIGAVAFFILRSRRRSKSVMPSQEPYRTEDQQQQPQNLTGEKTHYAGHPGGSTPAPAAPSEMQAAVAPAPVEMDTGVPVQEWYGQGAAEMESNPSGTLHSHAPTNTQTQTQTLSQYSSELPTSAD